MSSFLPPSALLGVSLLVGGCAAPVGERAEVHVFAAASLTDAFAALERDYESAHPEVDLRMTFAGSQVLRLQIEQGARADLFASADPTHVAALTTAGLAEDPMLFARNPVVIAVPADGSSPVKHFEDLPKARRLVLGAKSVPVGRYAEQILDRAGEPFAGAVRARIVSRETNVRLVRAKVELGEADAAFVYRSDTVGSDRVAALPLPDHLRVDALYPVVRLRDAARPDLARAFARYLAGTDAEELLTTHGLDPGGP